MCYTRSISPFIFGQLSSDDRSNERKTPSTHNAINGLAMQHLNKHKNTAGIKSVCTCKELAIKPSGAKQRRREKRASGSLSAWVSLQKEAPSLRDTGRRPMDPRSHCWERLVLTDCRNPRDNHRKVLIHRCEPEWKTCLTAQ